jgi:hypothetical protein
MVALQLPIMNENNSEQVCENLPVAHVKADYTWGRWLSDWAVMLCDVFLFASAVNCLFLWLSYGRTFDGAAFAFSLLLALTVYYLTIYSSRFPSIQKRLLTAVGAVVVWAVLMPVIMHLLGYR